MSSAYAPLPFSYLSADGPKPRPGMRKDGVYGTSADVPRIYEEPDPSQRDAGSGTGFVNNPYNVYSNAQQVRLDNYEAVYRPSQTPQPPVVALTPRTAQESPYDVRQRPDLLEGRAQNPHGGGEYHVYSIPEADYVTSDKDLRQREDRKPGYGIRQPELSTPKQERIQSYYPPDIDKYPRGQNEVMAPSANDNFILVKDPNRTDPKPVSDAATLNRDAGGKTKLQTLFEDSGPTPMPRHNHSNTTSNPSHELGYEEPNHSSSYGLNAAESPMGNGKGPKEMTLREHRAKTAYAEKGSKGKQCCHCSKCTAVILAIIITAVICLGVGFVAGWFGAMADRDKNAANPTSQPTAAFNEQTTNTTTASSSLATTKESTSTTKTSTTSAHLSSTTTSSTTTTTARSYASSAESSATSNATTKSVSAPTG